MRILPAHRDRRRIGSGRRGVLTLAGAAVLLVACGGDPGGTAASTPSTTVASSSSLSSGSGSPSTVSSSTVSSRSVSSGSVSSSGPVTSVTSSAAGGLDERGCIADYDPQTDYYPDKLQLEYSSTMTIEYRRSFAVLTVTPPGGAAETYVLLRCGAPRPELSGALAGAQVVTTPVTDLYSASTTHLPSLVALDRLSVVTGVGAASFVSEPAVLQYFSAHKPVEFAPTGQIDAETVIAGAPQVLIGGGFADAADGKVRAAGVPVLQDLDAQELTPLGQAEWIKFFGALTGTESVATGRFDAIASEYQRLSALTTPVEKVLVVANQPYQGEWYVPGGKSNKQRLLADAGARTANSADGATGSVATTFEKVFATSAQAPYWIASTTWTSESDALQEDPRFARFTAMRSHQVWNPIKGVTAAGGNPYYELGGLRVDLALADLIAIVHPELVPDHVFTFYQRLD